MTARHRNPRSSPPSSRFPAFSRSFALHRCKVPCPRKADLLSRLDPSAAQEQLAILEAEHVLVRCALAVLARPAGKILAGGDLVQALGSAQIIRRTIGPHVVGQGRAHRRHPLSGCAAGRKAGGDAGHEASTAAPAHHTALGGTPAVLHEACTARCPAATAWLDGRAFGHHIPGIAGRFLRLASPAGAEDHRKGQSHFPSHGREGRSINRAQVAAAATGECSGTCGTAPSNFHGSPAACRSRRVGVAIDHALVEQGQHSPFVEVQERDLDKVWRCMQLDGASMQLTQYYQYLVVSKFPSR
jgi:hypothetical protein